MIKKMILTLTAVASLAVTQKASANLYVDFDDLNDVFLSVTGTKSVTGWFNIANKGYDPTTEHVTGALAAFYLYDDADGIKKGESYSINLGQSQFSSGSSTFNLVFGLLGLVGGPVEGSMLLDLSADGKLKYTIEATKGDFYVDWAKLIAVTHPNRPNTTGNRVPDGGLTLAMLGLGCLGVAALRRRS